jgi:7-cyano-7-deazaguanine synthase
MIAVLLSGGMDSAAALYLAVERHGRENVSAVFVTYGQKAAKQENRASWALADRVGVPWIPTEIGVSGGSITHHGEGALVGPDTVVPNRNRELIMAAHLWGDEVWFAPHADDWVIYEDCRPEFVRSFPFSVVAPFLYLTKADIRRIGDRLGVPWPLTWSCYAPIGGELPCGTCGACAGRHFALGVAE